MRGAIALLSTLMVARAVLAQTTATFRDGEAFDGGYLGTRNLQLMPGTLYQWNPAANYGSDNILEAAGAPVSSAMLIKWDLSSLSPSTQVTSAVFAVHVF